MLTTQRDFPTQSPNKLVELTNWGVTLLTGLVYMLNVPEPVKVSAGIVFIVTLLFQRPVESIKHLMFITSANQLLDIGTTSLTMFLMPLLAAKYCFLKRGKIRVNGSLLLCLVALSAISVAMFVMGSSGQLVATIKHLFFLSYTAIVLTESRSDLQALYKNVFRNIALGIVYFSGLSFLLHGLPALTARFTFSEEVTINALGIFCSLSIINMLYANLILNDRSSSKGNLALMLGCAFVGLLTQSRTFIAATTVGVLLLFSLTTSFKKKCAFMIGGALFVTLLGITIAYVPALNERIDVVMQRFIDPSNGDLSNGRYQLWETTISSMCASPRFFWLGAGDESQICATAYDSKALVAHNLWLETWVIYGVLGFAILVAAYYYFIRHVVLGNSKVYFTLYSLIPVLLVFCALTGSHHFIGRGTSIVFAMSFLPLLFKARIA